MQPERFLIIGGSGFLGSQIVQYSEQFGTVFKTHCSQPKSAGSIKYNFFEDDIAEVLDLDQFDIVVFASMVEMHHHPDKLSSRMNLFTKRCQHKRLVYLSSDGIFNGDRGLYSEQDVPEPITTYGKNLLVCEEIISEKCSNFSIVRPSYLYGYSCEKLDHRLSATKSKLESGEIVEYFEDMYKSPLNVQQAAISVLNISQSDIQGVTHISGERLSVYDFHFRAMKALGVDVSNLRKVKMPIKKGFLRDTSLDFQQWQALSGFVPRSIENSLMS